MRKTDLQFYVAGIPNPALNKMEKKNIDVFQSPRWNMVDLPQPLQKTSISIKAPLLWHFKHALNVEVVTSKRLQEIRLFLP